MAVIIRPATRADVSTIVDLAVESVSVDPLPVVIDRQAMRDTAIAMVGNTSQFLWVAEVAGKVVAAVAVSCCKAFWFKGWQASMLLFWSRHAGAAIPLLRKLVEWIKDRPIIKVAVIECEPAIDPRAIKFLKRLGFARESVNLVYVRGVSL